MAITFKLYRGTKAKLPTLAAGQPAFTTDEGGFYVGDGTNNIEYARADHTHPGGLFLSADIAGLTNIVINDGVYNQSLGRIEASYVV